MVQNKSKEKENKLILIPKTEKYVEYQEPIYVDSTKCESQFRHYRHPASAECVFRGTRN